MPNYHCKYCKLTISDHSAYNRHIGHCIPAVDVKISEGCTIHFERKEGKFDCTIGKCSQTYDTANGFKRHVKNTHYSPSASSATEKEAEKEVQVLIQSSLHGGFAL